MLKLRYQSGCSTMEESRKIEKIIIAREEVYPHPISLNVSESIPEHIPNSR